MKKLIVLFLTIALCIFMFSCYSQANFNASKKALADTESEMSLIDFNIKTGVRALFYNYSNIQIKKTNNINDINYSEIGISNANWQQHPTGNWDSPFLQLTNESSLLCDSSFQNSSYVFLFTFHYSMSINDFGYYTYIPVYISKVKAETPIQELFFDFTPNLVNGSYDSGVFYSLTSVDIYSANASSDQWSPFPIFNYRDFSAFSSSKSMYLNPSYMLYNGTTDNTKTFKTDAVALICYDRYDGQGSVNNLDSANITSYTTKRNLKYKITQNTFNSVDTRFYRYNNLFFTFVQGATPDQTEMIFDANTTDFYLEFLNSNSQYVKISYWGYPSTIQAESSFEWFSNNISQVLETNYTIEPTPPPDDGEGTTQNEQLYRNLGIIASIPVLIIIVPFFAIGLAGYSLGQSIINSANFGETFSTIFKNVINSIINFFTELTKDIIGLSEKIIDEIGQIPGDVPQILKYSIGAGIVAIILLLVGFVIYQILKRR